MHDPISIAHFGIKSSPHRPYLSMQTSNRLYQCCRCHAQVIVCSPCDRGQRYCLDGCRQKARKASLKRASQKYQASRAGRFNNADRQKRFRLRQKLETIKVTHHGSPQIPSHAVLKTKPEYEEKLQIQPQLEPFLICHHCGSACGLFLRRGFLHHTRTKRLFRRH